MDTTSIFLTHVLATVLMTGICWFVQVIHYPLFLEISDEDFPTYEKKNYRTAYLTVTIMVVELLTGLYLLTLFNTKLFLVNMILLLVIELSTIIFQIPIQLGLSKESSKSQKLKLINTNLIRTVSWSLRTVLLFIIILNHLNI